MTRLACIALQVALAVAALAAVPRPAAADPCTYAIVVSAATRSAPEWAAVVEALAKKHRDRGVDVIEWKESVDEAVAPLAASMPRHACFVAKPEEAGREFVAAVHRLTRRLDDDPYADVLWGILTGFDAANALAIAKTSEPLVVKRVTSGTELAMDRVVEGEWTCELEKNRMVRKRAGGDAEEVRGPDDTTAALAARLNDGLTDLFVTSGHATERDWQIGFAYKNGQFRSGGGRLWGVDTAGTRIPIESDNPKVWLPVGNCLAGHIDGPDALALAFMNAAGVRQMIGYTVPTWFGYAGWGCLDTFLEQPGRYTLAEAFHANQHALVHRLATHAAPRDDRGLTFDRDVVAFYGDPAWEARLATGKLQYRQTLMERDGTFTLEVEPLDGPRSFAPVNTNGSQRGGRPIVQFLPRRLTDVEIMSGEERHPVVTDTFVLVPLPPADSTDTLTVTFRGRDIAN
jgi:zinc protease